MILGGAMVGSLTEVIMFFLYKKYMHKFLMAFVISCTLVTICVILLGLDIDYFAIGSTKSLALGLLSLFITIILQKFVKGIIKNSAILTALIICYIASAFLEIVNTQAIADTLWFILPIPMNLKLEFSFYAILIYITYGLWSIVNTSEITISGFDIKAAEKETSETITEYALGSTTAVFFNCLKNTAFIPNAVIVSMIKVINKFCIATGAFVLMLCRFFTKLGAVFSPITRGSIITLFDTILINGIKIIVKAAFNKCNIIVMIITFALGLRLANHQNAVSSLNIFIEFIFYNTVYAACIIYILSNFIFYYDKISNKPEDYNA
ncbi:solute carrier family 23 protein [Brachyspira murdochii]|uniref:solute carrier family 23 protein n=1 Tax=Brachyspira murdochii TaxID=84378 RepID=UPI001CA5AD4C|nr:solute carrier family 23 protein [Brachyspira murdochii]